MAFQEKAQKSYTSLGKCQRRPALAPNLNASSLGTVGGYSSLACPASLNGPFDTAFRRDSNIRCGASLRLFAICSNIRVLIHAPIDYCPTDYRLLIRRIRNLVTFPEPLRAG
jgi:hypothetical protein